MKIAWLGERSKTDSSLDQFLKNAITKRFKSESISGAALKYAAVGVLIAGITTILYATYSDADTDNNPDSNDFLGF